MNFNLFAKSRMKYLAVFVVLALLAAVFVVVVVRNPATESGDSLFVKTRDKIIRNEVVVFLLHSYHSIRKLPDIVFFPYFFREPKIPVYNLYVSPQDMRALNDALPNDPIGGYLYDENRLWVKGVFTAGDYQEKVKVKFRGTNANHWNSLQRSWRVKFPEEHLFNGMETLDFVIPYDRNYFVEPTNLYRAKKLGLTTPDIYYSQLNLNGQNSGVYMTFERWSDGFLEKKMISTETGVFMGDDARSPGDALVDSGTTVIETPDGPVYLNKLTSGAADDGIKALNSIIENTDDETFKKIIGNIFDLKKFYAWNIVNILAGSGHRGDYFYDGNIITIFNPITGKFELNPWDTGIMAVAGLPAGEYKDNAFKLLRRILSVPEFRQERDAMLAAYLKDGKQLADDLAFYNNLYGKTKGDFFRDSAKLYNNFQFLNQVKSYRKIMEDNFARAARVLSYGADYYKNNGQSPAKTAELFLGGTFSRFLETGYTIDEFMAANPAFVKRGATAVALPAGTHIFRKDVIIPSGLRLTIDAGATIYFDKGISLVSYSPVAASGAIGNKIKMSRLDAREPWGVFVVINAGGEKSIIDNVDFDGGNIAAGLKINGIIITGMVAFHNADVDISNSFFKNSGSDDGLNVKYGLASIIDCVFANNFSDGLDMDFEPQGAIVRGNKFYDNGYGGGGDAIDISWSDLKIEDNYIKGCTDKGISVGESSKPIIKNNAIEQCDIGIAVKDSSIAEIIGNKISLVRVGIDAYRKKQAFGGGVANLSGNIIKDAKTDYSEDDLSEINILK